MHSHGGLLELFILAGILIALFAHAARRRRQIARILEGHLGDPPTLEQLQEQLSELNAESGRYVFEAERHANIAFRDHRLSVIAGKVGSAQPGAHGPSWRRKATI